jgi:hypothetical protein
MLSINYFDLVCVILTVSSSSFGATPGLYDCHVFTKTSKLRSSVKSTRCDKTLVITHLVRSDDREKRCRTFVEDRDNKIEGAKLDMKALQVDISTKLAEFEDEYLDTEPGDIEKGLSDILALRGKHKAELKSLESYADTQVASTQTTRGESVVLDLKELVQVGFFEEPVVYLQSPLVAAPVKITELV